MDAHIKFAKVRPDAKIPNKREEDAAMDIYACFDDNYMEIMPNETKMIPTGIMSACEKDYCIILKERGSTGSKGMALRCGVIDSGYRGEIFVAITNTTDKIIFISKLQRQELLAKYINANMREQNSIIYPYEKAIAQALVIPVPNTVIEEVSYEELQMIASERGTGKLGSSNK